MVAKQLRSFNRYDAMVAIGLFALLYAAVHVGQGMFARFSPEHPPSISLNPALLPYYAARSVLRMFVALALSVAFSLAYGSIAAKNRRAEQFLIPLLDILQSVPVLGFLSATLAFFLSLFPTSLFGLELASIFAIFTGQVWNMTFAFYHSLLTLPEHLKEAAAMMKLSRWQKFWKVEVSYAMLPLVWNGMMSFAGGWFFLAASEAITVLRRDYRLPGLGSYMATAVEQGNLAATLWAIGAMIVTIVLVDQFFWRPIVAWAEKFRAEETEAVVKVSSWVLNLLQQTHLLRRYFGRLAVGVGEWLDRRMTEIGEISLPEHTRLGLGRLMTFALITFCAYWFLRGVIIVVTDLSIGEMLRVVGLGFVTLARVIMVVVISTVLWVPIGVFIGLHPNLARFAQPLVQIAASFPANMLYPLLAFLFLQTQFPFAIGSILPLMLGAQWYVLFNAIAGAMSIPTELREAVAVFRLPTREQWLRLILPALFPHWVTGAITAWGGAWNASIVAEVIEWHKHKLTTVGLGAYITHATVEGHAAAIVWGIAVMSAFVVVFNRLFWQRLYRLAESRYKLE
jgi:NitT/TauT family transport system permease protein